jgi:hypothetical protein
MNISAPLFAGPTSSDSARLNILSNYSPIALKACLLKFIKLTLGLLFPGLGVASQ